MKNLVLAGGRASKELSVLVPKGKNKVLLRIMGKPIIYYSLTSLQKVNRTQTILVYRAGEESVYQEASNYSIEPLIPVTQISGNTVHEAIIAASSKLEDTDYFFLIFGDLVIEEEALSQLLSIHLSEEPDATVLAVPIEPKHIETYGLLVVDEYNRVSRVVEGKTAVSGPLYITGGAYILPTWILDYLEKNYTLPQALDEIARKGRVRAVNWSGLWIDIGYPTDLLEAAYQLLSRVKGKIISDKAEVESTAVIEGPVIIEDKAYVDHYAVIKGPAYIGRSVFVGAHSFVRDYTDLEEKTRIGAYTEIRYSVLQPYVSTHSRVLIMDSIIGENTVLESNITILNVLPEEEEPPRLRTHIVSKPQSKIKKLGAVIGYNSKIHAGVVIKPGSIIEPNTVYR
ncbi:MAG: NDP-sugar synthase [Thermoprotei archaeon]